VAALTATAMCSCMGLIGERPNKFEKLAKGIKVSGWKSVGSIKICPLKVTYNFYSFVTNTASQGLLFFKTQTAQALAATIGKFCAPNKD
jgi:hypothetical protein